MYFYYSNNIEGQNLRLKKNNILCKHKFPIGSILYARVHLLNESLEKWGR